MRLHRLTVTAFGPFGATQEIDFDALSGAGIFLLHGATGAGKTSVLDAVCFALYGAVPGARQSPGTSLRSDHAPAGTPTEVLLDLTVGGRRLEIRRRPAQPRPKKNGRGVTTERAQSQLREYDAEQGAWRALSRSHQEIGEEITQLVGMSREQFCQVVLLPQGDFARFLRSDAEARARLLGRLFDTGRFAAVEERLAERRRTAEGRVRTADEGLLAIAHRMEQAAGAAADDWPPPRQQPGDPGLADAVLEWAAVARAGAAERRDIAEGALTAAEHRQRAAREALESAQEEERLQRRYEDARRRRAVLEDRRPEYEELCDRLDRARRAERVAPALRLRDDAAREHTVAGTAYEEARALLPAELREAGAEQLAAAEARLRQDLGGLEAALRAERRSEEITRERAALDRQARADEEILQDAEGWLAGWEALRHGHQERIAAAQDAATRAEHLAGRLDPARRRLRAARERDRLAVLGVTAEEGLRTARDRAGRAREQWLDLKERRLLGIAAELAAELAPGRPCTVCGSAEHPEPARPTDGSVTAAQEDSAYDHYTRADAAKATAERELAVLTEALTTARTQARSVSPPTGTSSSPANGTGGPDRSPATAAPASGASGASGSGTAVVTPGTGPAGPVAAGAAARAGGGESGRLPGPVDSGRARGADAVGGAVAGGPANGSDTAGGFRVPVAAAGGGAGGVPVATDGVGGPDTSGVRTGGPGRFPGAGKPDRLSGGPACGAAGPAGPGSSVVPVAAAGEGPEGMDAAGGFRVPVADAGAGGAPVPTDGVGGPGGTAGPVGAGAGAGEAGPFGVVGGGSGGADGEPSATGESVPAPSGGDRAVGGSVGGGVPGRAQGAGGSVAPMVAGGGAAGAA
ncbi:AAA family ATPase, partial [Streptomyces clavuligerus]